VPRTTLLRVWCFACHWRTVEPSCPVGIEGEQAYGPPLEDVRTTRAGAWPWRSPGIAPAKVPSPRPRDVKAADIRKDTADCGETRVAFIRHEHCWSQPPHERSGDPAHGQCGRRARDDDAVGQAGHRIWYSVVRVHQRRLHHPLRWRGVAQLLGQAADRCLLRLLARLVGLAPHGDPAPLGPREGPRPCGRSRAADPALGSGCTPAPSSCRGAGGPGRRRTRSG